MAKTDVWLVPHHTPLRLNGGQSAVLTEAQAHIQLEESMLSWPIYTRGRDTELLGDRMAGVYRNCLHALLLLHPFTAIMSIQVDVHNERLLPASLDWCRIYYQGASIARFTHEKQRYETGHAYQSVAEWTERVGVTDREAIFRWNTDCWGTFFLNCIQKDSPHVLADVQEGMYDTASLRAA